MDASGCQYPMVETHMKVYCRVKKHYNSEHLLGLYRMDALTRLKHIGFGGFSPHFTIPRFLHPTDWRIYEHLYYGDYYY
jgi:hypothetical protein